MQRGLVTPDRTTLITSTHRTLAVIEKVMPGTGIFEAEPVLDAARKSAKRFLGADLEQLAAENGSVISASLFGALAGADVLPFPRESFEATIAAGGRGAAQSLKAFSAGFAADRAARRRRAPTAVGGSSGRAAAQRADDLTARRTRRRAWSALADSVASDFPAEARAMLLAGLQKVVDFQDLRYGREYLDRLKSLHALDVAAGGAGRGFRFTVEAAKYLANAMAYDDVIRVADLKTRASRFRRVEKEIGVGDDAGAPRHRVHASADRGGLRHDAGGTRRLHHVEAEARPRARPRRQQGTAFQDRPRPPLPRALFRRRAPAHAPFHAPAPHRDGAYRGMAGARARHTRQGLCARRRGAALPPAHQGLQRHARARRGEIRSRCSPRCRFLPGGRMPPNGCTG